MIDTISGRIAYSAQFDAIGEVKAAMVENWLVVAWKGKDGWRMTSVELYEDVKGKGEMYV